jgi:outer membrane protein TolC
MRLYQQFRASIGRSAVSAAGVLLFASGMPVSVSGQTQQPSSKAAEGILTAVPVKQSTVPAGTPLSLDEAVRMALENNLGLQIERLNPEIQVLGIARANSAYAPTLFSNLNRSSATAPPGDFLSAGGAAVVTDANFRTTGGVQQQVRAGGGSYQVSLDGSRATSNAARTLFSPRLGSNMNAAYTQPLLRNFKIDGFRQQLLLSRNQAQAADIQLQQRVTQTSRNVRAAYYRLIGAIAGLDVAQQSLELSRTSLKNNQTRVEVGTMAQIDIISTQAEVASNEELVIIQQAAIESAQDNLRGLIMNPAQPEFWNARFTPSEQPTISTKAIDLDAAIKAALANRTDLREFKKSMESTDINMQLARNQKMPAVDLTARYGLTGIGGTQFKYGTPLNEGDAPPVLGQTVRGFGEVLRDVFGNNFKTWSFALNVSYPIGTSQADAAYAQAKLQKQQEQRTLASLELAVTLSVRDAARQVNTNLKRVEATRKALEFAEKRLDAENKRFTVGLSSTFELLQAQRDLARAKQSELNATIDYNQSLVDFEAVQIAPIR